MSLLGRLERRATPGLTQVRAAVDDLGRANHRTATDLDELRGQVARLSELVDPVRAQAARDAIDSMLSLVAGAIAASEEAQGELRRVTGELQAVRARVAGLEESVAALHALLAEDLSR